MATARWRGSYYEIRVSCGLDSHGKRLYEYAHWKPTPEMTPKQVEKELERQKVLFEDKVRHGEIVNANIYFRTSPLAGWKSMRSHGWHPRLFSVIRSI